MLNEGEQVRDIVFCGKTIVSHINIILFIEARRANLDGVGVMLRREESANLLLNQVGCCCQYCLPRMKNTKNKEANENGRE